MKEHVETDLEQLNMNMLSSARRQITALLSLFVVLGVFWGLKLTGITLAGEAFCGMDEHYHGEECMSYELICSEPEWDGHVHSEDCRALELICTIEECEGHVHGDDCFSALLICAAEETSGHSHGLECYEITQTCTLEEVEGHLHGESCFLQALICDDEDPEHEHGSECYETTQTCTLEEVEGHLHGESCFLQVLICTEEEVPGHEHSSECYELTQKCTEEETEGHHHDEACYVPVDGFACGWEEDEGHVHTDECYQRTMICTREEHIHVESCYSNIKADLETETDWEQSVQAVTDEFSTAGMLVSLARSQLGYTESTLNFEVDLHGVRRGITRYGQWYGNPYGDWSAMFVSFCLYYAGIDDLPFSAGPETMRLEWESIGLYEPAEGIIPQVGNLIFLSSESDSEFSPVLDTEEVSVTESAAVVAIVTEVTEGEITVIQGDFDDAVSERTLNIDDPTILGYGLVPERSPYMLMMSPRTGERTYLGHTINYNSNMFTEGRSFVLYAEHGGQYYALVSQPANGVEAITAGVPVEIDAQGRIYGDVADPDSLLWNFTRNGNNYVIQNVSTKRYLHPGGDPGVIFDRDWPTALRASGTGAKFVHTDNNHNNGIYFNGNQQCFEIVRDKNNASTIYFGVIEKCSVWLDGTSGGIPAFGGSQNQRHEVMASSELILPAQWLSPIKYSYKLRGWYDVTHNQYYAPGEAVTITENTVFYADWMADTYDIGRYNAHVANTVSTNSFVTTHLFDYTYLFNVLSADASVTCSDTGHSENWSIVQNENVNYQDRETLNFIFLDYGSDGLLDYPNNRQNGVNAYPGEGIVTGGIYNSDIGNALFATDDRLPGKVYLGTGDHLFQIMDDPSDPYYGYYYYDSARNAASYNQSDGRFYVYDYLEATSAELTATKSDFLPLNSPYANTNGKQLGTYVPDSEHAKLTNYVYDAKYEDADNSVNRVSTNYAFGMKIDIRFYLPNKPGEDGNKDVYGNDMHFMFSGDDDLWVLVDGKLALDIGGIHKAESGEINFSTGEVLVQGARDNALSGVVSALEPGEHTLTVMYLERGASHSNCAIYFNLAPRFRFGIQKEDVLTRGVLNGAQFSVYCDFECTVPAELWENQESYLRGDPATNVFTVADGTATMWGMGAGNTYYIRETRPPNNTDYGFPNGIIRMVLDKRGAATYSVMILDEGDGISGGFTVHGFRVDEETQQAYIIATNAPKWVKEVTSVQARKFWADGEDHSDQTITVYLTIHDPDGTVRRLQEAQINDETDWQHLWENLPKYYEDGTEIHYGVEEAYVPGYYSQVDKVDTYTVTTTQWTATTSLENGKTYLLRTVNGCLSTQNRNSDTGYMWVDEAIAKESDLALWAVTSDSGGYKLTNKAGQSITFYYNGGSPTDFYAYTGGESSAAKQYFKYSVSGSQIRLYYDAPNNRDYYLIGSMTGSQKFRYSEQSGNALLFTPLTLTQTTVTKPVNGQWTYQITNTPLETETSLTVHKQWRIDIGDDPNLYQQAQVTVKLLANGKDTGRTVTLNLKNGWTEVFRSLPYMDSGGNVVQYTVEESWTNKDWMAEYGPIISSGDTIPTYDTTVTNVYRWGHGVELPSTGSPARLLFILCGSSIMLFTLVLYGIVSRRKRERRMN